jgi:hypothetical protein
VRPIAKDRVRVALRLVRRGTSLLETSERTGIARATLKRYAVRAGIKIDPKRRAGPHRRDPLRGGPGNRYIDRDGYVLVYAPDHPWPRAGKVVRENVMVMELHLGRRICANECVHHKDEDRQNNELSNLELKTRGAHSRLHRLGDTHRRQRDAHGRFV